jgi:hypothetical protein
LCLLLRNRSISLFNLLIEYSPSFQPFFINYIMDTSVISYFLGMMVITNSSSPMMVLSSSKAVLASFYSFYYRIFRLLIYFFQNSVL